MKSLHNFMKSLRNVQKFAAVLFLTVSAALAQQPSGGPPVAPQDNTKPSANPSFTGHYKGTATNKAQEVIPVEIDLTDAGGNLSGEINSTFGTFPIVGGTRQADTIVINFDAGGQQGIISAKLSDGRLLGTFSAGGDEGPVDARKTADVPGSAGGGEPQIPSTGFAGLDQYRARRIAVFTDDYGQLARYREANAALAPPAANEKRVVFFGDSITDIWKLADYFPGKPYLNRGIGGQTTPQMLVRFRQDVIDLHPKVVVVLAGTNDIAGNTGPMRNEDIEANYASMAELARAHGIALVFSSVLPVHDYTEKSKDFYAQRPRERILALNLWLKDYCAKNRLVYLDYFSSLVDDQGMLKRDLADDGLHPNDAGFKIMAPLAEKAIAIAMR